MQEGVLTCPARPLQGAEQPATTLSRELPSLVAAVQQQGSTSAAIQRAVEVCVGCPASMRTLPHSCRIWALRPLHNALLHRTRLQQALAPSVTLVLVPFCSHLAPELPVPGACRTW